MLPLLIVLSFFFLWLLYIILPLKKKNSLQFVCFVFIPHPIFNLASSTFLSFCFVLPCSLLSSILLPSWCRCVLCWSVFCYKRTINVCMHQNGKRWNPKKFDWVDCIPNIMIGRFYHHMQLFCLHFVVLVVLLFKWIFLTICIWYFNIPFFYFYGWVSPA